MTGHVCPPEVISASHSCEDAMKVVVGIVLHVGCTNPSITHDSRCASWLNGRSSIAVTTVVLGVIHIELMPHFVGDIVNVKGSPTGAPDYSTGF